jgi:hypothetical protein
MSKNSLSGSWVATPRPRQAGGGINPPTRGGLSVQTASYVGNARTRTGEWQRISGISRAVDNERVMEICTPYCYKLPEVGAEWRDFRAYLNSTPGWPGGGMENSKGRQVFRFRLSVGRDGEGTSTGRTLRERRKGLEDDVNWDVEPEAAAALRTIPSLRKPSSNCCRDTAIRRVRSSQTDWLLQRERQRAAPVGDVTHIASAEGLTNVRISDGVQQELPRFQWKQYCDGLGVSGNCCRN